MLFLVTVVVAWGLTWPVNKVILKFLSPLWAVTLRTAIAAVVLVAVAWLGGRLVRPPRGDLPVLLSITLLHIVGFSVLSSWGLMLVPAGRSVVLAYTTPLWVIPGAWLFLGERLTRRRAAGVAIGLLGLLTLFNPLALDWGDHEVILGHLAIVAAAMLWAGSILHIRGHRWRSTPFALLPWETMLATGILAVLALTLSDGVPEVTWTLPLILLVLYAGIPGSALAYWAVAMASRNLPAVTTSLGLLATPVVSVIASTVFLGEPLTPTLMVAVVLILGGVALGTAEA
jgi:drug/metabolite transporter (DMT)-like permease